MILVFELTTILSGSTRDWVDFGSHAQCYLPEVVLQELNFLTQRAVTPKEEKIAREFNRFFPDSGWEITSTMSAHPAISPKETESISKQARLIVAIAESVYDLALRNSEEIVVLVSSNGNLKRDLLETGIKNLAVISSAQLKQWIRYNEIPMAVTDIIEQSSVEGNNSASPPKIKKDSPSRQINPSSRRNNNIRNSSNTKVKSKESFLQIIKSGFLAIGSLIITVGVAWYFIAPESFSQMWERMGFPPLEMKNK